MFTYHHRQPRRRRLFAAVAVGPLRPGAAEGRRRLRRVHPDGGVDARAAPDACAWAKSMGHPLGDFWWVGTLWLCQNSYWKWPFIVDFPIKNSDFP